MLLDSGSTEAAPCGPVSSPPWNCENHYCLAWATISLAGDVRGLEGKLSDPSGKCRPSCLETSMTAHTYVNSRSYAASWSFSTASLTFPTLSAKAQKATSSVTSGKRPRIRAILAYKACRVSKRSSARASNFSQNSIHGIVDET